MLFKNWLVALKFVKGISSSWYSVIVVHLSFCSPIDLQQISPWTCTSTRCDEYMPLLNLNILWANVSNVMIKVNKRTRQNKPTLSPYIGSTLPLYKRSKSSISMGCTRSAINSKTEQFILSAIFRFCSCDFFVTFLSISGVFI